MHPPFHQLGDHQLLIESKNDNAVFYMAIGSSTVVEHSTTDWEAEVSN